MPALTNKQIKLHLHTVPNWSKRAQIPDTHFPITCCKSPGKPICGRAHEKDMSGPVGF
jgi:hypothetical protein